MSTESTVRSESTVRTESTESTRPAQRPPAVPARSITTRRINFDFQDDFEPKHFVDGDLVMSHVIAMLSAMFPNGEDFFADSVRNYRDRVTDPELKKQVARFIGQESIHGREHRVLNERLQHMGYKTSLIDRSVEIGMKRIAARVLPKSVQLAVTAALEHYTATAAEVLMESTEAQEALIVDEIRYLLLWHAMEESEHKAVAFDVYQTAVGDQLLRARVMDVVTVLFLLGIVLSTVRSMLSDPASRDLRRVRASLRRLRESPFATPAVWRRLRDYNRRDFHPDDNDAGELLERWRTELFGSGGVIADHLEKPVAGAA